MSRRDTRFKSLKFVVNHDNGAWEALAIGKTWHIVKVEKGYRVIGTFESNGVYAEFSDAKVVCQLDFERRMKEWISV